MSGRYNEGEGREHRKGKIRVSLTSIDTRTDIPPSLSGFAVTIPWCFNTPPTIVQHLYHRRKFFSPFSLAIFSLHWQTDSEV